MELTNENSSDVKSTADENSETISVNDSIDVGRSVEIGKNEVGMDSDNMAVDALPSIEEQKALISNLNEKSYEIAKEGDPVFVIPSSWHEKFWDPNLKSLQDMGPIDTLSICKDFNNGILEDHHSIAYQAVPKSVFEKFMEWYGLSYGSKPIETVLVADEQGTLHAEYQRSLFRVYLLTEKKDERRRYQSEMRPLFFTKSKLNVIEDVYERCLEIFAANEASFNPTVHESRVWYVKENSQSVKEQMKMSQYRMSLLDFAEMPLKRRITTEMFRIRVKDVKFQVVDLVVEYKVRNKTHHWPSNYFFYHPLTPSKGITGLSNLGNSCYMNSAIQCLVHIPEVKDYFLYRCFEEELNPQNPLGYSGHIAQAFGTLVCKLFSETNSLTSYVPRSFQTAIGRYNSLFSGYLQQDSQEFLAFLLDGLHEDLNRIKAKPYVEKPELKASDDVHDLDVIKNLAESTWQKHKLRNDSIITDLFVGMYKSTLICPECKKISITFDPYNDLTLPLPVESHWTSKVLLFPKNSPPCTLEVQLSRTSTYEDLKHYIANCANMEAKDLIGVDIYGHQFYSNFETSDSGSKFLPLSELISESDTSVFYEVPRQQGEIVVPVLNSRIEKGFTTAKLFGFPFFITLNQEEVFSYGAIRSKLEKAYCYLSGGFAEFPLLSKNCKTSAEELPFLKFKYAGIDLSHFESDISYCVPHEDLNAFFNIKVLNHNTESVAGQNGERNGSLPNSVWTPSPRADISAATEIFSSLSNIVRDIYNYKGLSESEGEELKELASLARIEDVSILSQRKDSEENSEPIHSDMDVDTDQSVGLENGITSKNSNISEEGKNGQILEYPREQLIKSRSVIICEWNENAAEIFSDANLSTWDRPALLPNAKLEAFRNQRGGNERKEIKLDECLGLFSQPEVLGATDSWYCPNCKEHRQALKRIELWSTPDILLIHLKRFQNRNSFSDKINDLVEFPISGFDISPFLASKEVSDSNIYDLIAVDNHYGGMGGGHYTAYVKNFADDNWYYFDDSRVSETSPEQSVSGAAYLLCYRRRNPANKVCGGRHFEEIISHARRDNDLKLEEFNDRQKSFHLENLTEDEIDADNFDMEEESCQVKDDNLTSVSEGPALEINEVRRISLNEGDVNRKKLRLIRDNSKECLKSPAMSFGTSDSEDTGDGSDRASESLRV
ncbi:LAMI_0G07646g1_1 [Lachancea mirantina]|uniref:ubiquitinyl hydrolase 1 n=1 Tax=Lachancea mirantina TaxID=1230905 RepID=A0A1G4K9T7_9SACH|nr:LAMI_0G07646g1_1 [Lachancea mirantina]